VLFDQNLPHKLRTKLAALGGHEIITAVHKGWGSLKNGELLLAAESDGFEVFVTGDAALVHEQNLAERRLAVVVLSTNNWPIIKNEVAQIFHAIAQAAPGSLQFVECGRFRRRRN
jgi:hypothetical protein